MLYNMILYNVVLIYDKKSLNMCNICKCYIYLCTNFLGLDEKML